MKRKMTWKAVFAAAFCLFFIPFAVMAQTAVDTTAIPPAFPATPEGISMEFLLSWVEALYGALLIAVSYLSAKIPGINKIPKTAYRVVAIGLVLAMLFLALGKTVPLALLFSFMGATSLYDLVLSLFKKTPKPDEGNATPAAAK